MSSINSTFHLQSQWARWWSGVFSVWLRNFISFKNTFLTSALWLGLEPLLYLLAFGLCLGPMVTPIDGEPYLFFFFPGLLTITVMFVAFHETTFNGFHRRENYSAMLTTSLTVQEILCGEILWASTKALLGASFIFFIGFISGLVTHWMAGFAFLVWWICGCLFATLGISLQLFFKGNDSFTYAQTLLIIPMSLFCATYFPMKVYPQEVQWALWSLPLTHATLLTRTLFNGLWTNQSLIHLSYLMFATCLLLFLNFSRFRRLKERDILQRFFE